MSQLVIQEGAVQSQLHDDSARIRALKIGVVHSVTIPDGRSSMSNRANRIRVRMNRAAAHLGRTLIWDRKARGATALTFVVYAHPQEEEGGGHLSTYRA